MNIDEEKNFLTEKLSEQYSQNNISLDEYERLLEYVNRMETSKEVAVLEKIIRENAVQTDVRTDYEPIPRQSGGGQHATVFSFRTANLKPHNGNGGSFSCVFGTNRIIVDSLPRGRTILNVETVFGSTEIIVARNIRITSDIVPFFSGVFMPDENDPEDPDLPELHIMGKAVFGNITIKRKKNKLFKRLIQEATGALFDQVFLL